MGRTIGQRIGGFGAALQGQLPQFEEQLRRSAQDEFERESITRQEGLAQTEKLDEKRKMALLKDAFGVQQFLRQNNPGGAVKLLQNRLSTLQQLGQEDTEDTVGLLEQLQSGDISGTFQKVSQVVDFATRSGVLKPEGSEGRPATLRTFDEMTKDMSPEDKKKAARIWAKLDPPATNQRSIEEELMLAEGRAEGKESGKGRGLRRAEQVSESISAAKTIPILRRSLTLLDTVKTSGIRNAALAAKRFFGVEGADEGELSANLGRAVLAQLRPIFGAQFTAREGDKLEAIEAGFSKSVENNQRLLRQLLLMADAEVRRGFAASPDEREREQLEQFISGEFDLTDEALQDIFITPGDRERRGLPAATPAATPLSTDTSRGIKFLGFE